VVEEPYQSPWEAFRQSWICDLLVRTFYPAQQDAEKRDVTQSEKEHDLMEKKCSCGNENCSGCEKVATMLENEDEKVASKRKTE